MIAVVHGSWMHWEPVNYAHRRSTGFVKDIQLIDKVVSVIIISAIIPNIYIFLWITSCIAYCASSSGGLTR